jgi:Regulators of stationary/sporulation gene expression
MKTEAIRKIDELGRIILPIDMRNALGWSTEVKVSIRRQGEQLILQTYKDSCFLCGSEDHLKPIHGMYICQNCIDETTK